MLGSSLLMKASGAAFSVIEPPFSAVCLLLHGDGANGSTTIIDSSPRPKTITAVGNARISTAQSKYGGSSIQIAANGDYLHLDGSSDFAFGTGEWTIEFFYYASVGTKTFNTIYDSRAAGGSSANGIVIFHNASASVIQCETGGVIVPIYGFTVGSWHHLAFSKVGTTLRAFLNGVQSGAPVTHTANIIANANRPLIGVNLNLDYALEGFLDEFRITAAGRYAGNFTPPTTPFPDF